MSGPGLSDPSLPGPSGPVSSAPPTPGAAPDPAHGPGPGGPPGTPGEGAAPGRGGPRSRAVRTTVEWVGVVVLALLAAFLVKTFVLQTFFIPSASMEPTLDIGDRVFVNKLAYDFHSVRRGDVVVFTLPPGESAGVGIDDLIKRVIGLPGDTIMSVGNQIYINGRPLNESSWLRAGTQLGPPVPRQKIPAGHYFLMGDNRDNSRDSRFFGPISENLIVGRAFVRIWPLSRLAFL